MTKVIGVTIFFNYPGIYSAKLFEATRGEVKYIKTLGESERLEEVRKFIDKKFKFKLGRSENNKDLSIIETWV